MSATQTWNASAADTAVAALARIRSIDIVRGLVMVLMAIDHVRVYSGLPAGGPTPGIFFTRWVTNFCAPAFVFLAGTSAYLYGERRPRAAVSRYLASRGLWLVVLELTVLRLAWTFNFDYAHYVLAGVIWAIGWCMVLLAALIWLRPAAVGGIGVTIICLHNLMDYAPGLRAALLSGHGARLWHILYFGGAIPLAGTQLAVLYSIVPWIGVMAAGYAFGSILRLEPARRDRWCWMIGGACVLAFLLLRGFNLYGNPYPWSPRQAPLLSFLSVAKYPASLQFLLMTLGPVLLVLPFCETLRGRAAGVLTTYGRVPFSFYLLHIPLIHAAALLVSLLRTGTVSAWLFTNHPMFNPDPPAGYTWSLPLLYLVWALVVAALYPVCAWYARLKSHRRDLAWLRYI